MKKNCYGISELSLFNIRNYKQTKLEFESNKSVFLFGDNGSGKTSILEAISLLSFSKGLRSSSLDSVVKQGELNALVEAKMYGELGATILKAEINFLNDSSSFKKKIFLENTQLKKQEHIDTYLNCLWIIPQMDNFFLQDNSNKRKFIDRMIFIIDKSHSKQLINYERLVKERNKILSNYEYIKHNKWLDIIEQQLSEITVMLTIARLDFIESINEFCRQENKYELELKFIGLVEDLLQQHKYALKVENIIKEEYFNSRKKDSITGITSIGAHKSKLSCFNFTSNQEAENCSTGEQKILLIHIIIAFIKLIHQKDKSNLILLLDEIMIHLDDENVLYIIKQFLNFNTQIFITSTNKNMLGELGDFFTYKDINQYH